MGEVHTLYRKSEPIHSAEMQRDFDQFRKEWDQRPITLSGEPRREPKSRS